MITGLRVSKGILLVNVAAIGLAASLGVWLGRDLLRSRPIPPPPPPRQAAATPGTQPSPENDIAAEKLGTYNVIPAKYLFNPQRSEGAPVTAAVAAPLPPKPVLHGLIVDGKFSVAYLEDAVSKRVLVYRVGDAVAGGTLEKIENDRIQIRRSDGQMDVLLRDPGKPQPQAAGGTGAPGSANAGSGMPPERPQRGGNIARPAPPPLQPTAPPQPGSRPPRGEAAPPPTPPPHAPSSD